MIKLFAILSLSRASKSPIPLYEVGLKKWDFSVVYVAISPFLNLGIKRHGYGGLEIMLIGQWKIGWRWYGPTKVPLCLDKNLADDDAFEKGIRHSYKDIVME